VAKRKRSLGSVCRDLIAKSRETSLRAIQAFVDTHRRELGLLAAASMLTSCIVIDDHPYPNGWEEPLPVPENACTDISGTFDDYGQGDRQKSSWTGVEVRGLSMYFWPSNQWKHLRAAKYVVIEQSEKAMKVSVWTLTELVALRELKRNGIDGYSCTRKGIAMDRPGHSSDDNFSGYANRTVTLFKDSEGSMVLKLENSGGGMFTIIPTYVAYTLWRRYPRFP
jgi:hypothetical protein